MDSSLWRTVVKNTLFFAITSSHSLTNQLAGTPRKVIDIINLPNKGLNGITIILCPEN